MFCFIINLFFYSCILKNIQNTCEHTLLHNYTINSGNVIYENQIDTFPELHKIVIEICNNGLDDDNDGLIDEFDLDCPCDITKYNSQCMPHCEIFPDNFSKIELKLKWASEHSVLNKNGFEYISSFIVSGEYVYSIGYDRFGSQFINYIQTINPKDGKNINKVQIDTFFFQLYSNILSYRNLGNTFDVLCTRNSIGELISYQNNVLLWKHEVPINIDFLKHPFLSDINEDGNPEVVSGNYIFNSQTGKLLLHMPGSAGCNFFSNFNLCGVGARSIAGDFTDHPGLEIACGDKLYLTQFSNLSDSIGNRFSTIVAPLPIKDGNTAKVDINLDGKDDIIVVRDNSLDDGGIWIWDPRKQELLAQLNPNDPKPKRGGIPTIANITGDCKPEFIVAHQNELRKYSYDGVKFLNLDYTIPTSDDSGVNSAAIFDLNGDGTMEIIYRDQTTLRVFDGPTGITLFQTPLIHSTAKEIPIVTDIDDDGNAEIIIDGTLPGDTLLRLFCFESAKEPWMPARKIWNQSSYHVTNVNDDMTIPRVPQNTASFFDTDSCIMETCPQVYNTFNVQATYRTQKGCVVRPDFSRDLTINATSSCVGDSLEICIMLSATDTNIIRQGVPVTCFPPPWDNLTDNILDQIVVTQDTTCMKIPRMPGLDSIMIVANYDGPIYPANFSEVSLRECDYTNNEFVLYTGVPDFTLDVLSYSCTTDSLIFNIETDNAGLPSSAPCLPFGCYFNPPDGQTPALEIINLCFSPDPAGTSYRYRDTFRVTIPLPIGQTGMWWTINDVGFGPGFGSSGISECSTDNNIASITFDITPLTLDLGPDLVKCATEVISLDAGNGFVDYVWSDFSTDPVFSTSLGGLHHLVATDQCGREYRDSVLVNIDRSNDIDLGDDVIWCPNEKGILNISGEYDKITWLPASGVNCDTCRSITVEDLNVSQVIVRGQKGACVSFDTLQINRKPLSEVFDRVAICQGESYSVGDSTWQENGTYLFPINDCDSVLHLLIETIPLDTVLLQRSICRDDSLLFFGDYLTDAGLYRYTTQGYRGCDSTIVLTLAVRDTIVQQDSVYICEGDSVRVFNQWVFSDTTLQEDGISVNGCDSTSIVTIQTVPLPRQSLELTLCRGDSVQVYGAWLTEEGQYPFRLPQSIGCDSIIDVRLYMTDRYEVLETINLCPGDSVLVFGSWVSESGLYEENNVSVSGCDSLIRINVRKIVPPQAPEISVDCVQEEIIASVSAGFSYLVVWDNGDTSRMTKYMAGDSARVRWYHEPDCRGSFSVVLPELPHAGTLILPGDTLLPGDTFLDIQINTDPAKWRVAWSPAGLFSCDTCAVTSLQTRENTDIELQLSHVSGCRYTHRFRVTFQPESEEWFIPNIFTPGRSGNNQRWQVTVPPGKVLKHCRVYDRWSDLVFSAGPGEDIEWDGTFRDQLVVPGVYVYIIEWVDTNGTSKILKGDITVLR